MAGRTGTAIDRASAVDLRELRLLRSTVDLLQAGDLGAALATFVAELSEELCLDDVSIEATADSETGERDESDGERAGQGAGATAEGPEAPPLPIAPGEVFALALQRGGRRVGLLSARARDGLSPASVLTLERVCDMLAVAIDSARILHDQQKTVAGLREIAEMKAAFLGSVTHELRTTVTIIEGFAMLLSRQAPRLDEAQRADFISRIWQSSRRLGTIVEDLLDLARLEGSGIKVVLQPLDLSELVPKIVGQVSPMLRRHVVDMTIAPNVTAVSDPGAIERVVVNLLSNAVRYTPPSTRVTVSLRAEGGRAVLAVADAGPGIPVAERSRIFDRFYRVDNGGVDLVRGMGIGLALVRDIVARHGGTIVVDETPGGGARFTVAIPLAD